jgi:hypothetical protein
MDPTQARLWHLERAAFEAIQSFVLFLSNLVVLGLVYFLQSSSKRGRTLLENNDKDTTYEEIRSLYHFTISIEPTGARVDA